MLIEPFECFIASKGRAPSDHFIQDHTEGINITPSVATLPSQFLRRDVRGASQQLCEVREGQSLRTFFRCDTEINEFDLIRLVHQDVLGTQVSMNYAVPMNVFERVTNVQRDSHGTNLWEFFRFCQYFPQWRAVEPFSDQVGLAAV